MGEAFLSFSNLTYLHTLTKTFNKRSFLSFLNFTYLHTPVENLAILLSNPIIFYICLSLFDKN